VDLGSARPFDADKSGFLQHVEVLRDRLTRECHSIIPEEMGTDFEQRLLRTLAQAIYDPATGRIAERFEDAIEFIIIHATEYAMISLHVKKPSMAPAPTGAAFERFRACASPGQGGRRAGLGGSFRVRP
jgi:hypothetical protein